MSAPREARKAGGSAEPLLAGLLLAVWAILAAIAPQFREPQGLLSMTREFAEAGLVALPMTFVIITGGIDLSVGSILGLSAISLGMLHQAGVPIGLATLGAVTVGGLAGLANGGLIVGLRIPPLIVTLGTMAAFRGIAMGISNGQSVSDFPPGFAMLGDGHYPLPFGLAMPSQLVWLLLLAAVAWVFLARTRYGRYTYAIGMREGAAQYAGLPVAGTKLWIYTLSGLLAGFAGAVATSHYQTAKPDLGMGLELDAITACVLGGVSIYGGSGGIVGTMLGLWIVGSLRRGLVYAGMDAQSVSIVVGAVLILAVCARQLIAPAIAARRSARQNRTSPPLRADS